MSTQSLTPFESLREPTGPEISRQTTVNHAVFNIERSLQGVEAAAIAYLNTRQVSEAPAEPKLDMPQASVASIAVESSANDEDAAKRAVAKAIEEFGNAN